MREAADRVFLDVVPSPSAELLSTTAVWPRVSVTSDHIPAPSSFSTTVCLNTEAFCCLDLDKNGTIVLDAQIDLSNGDGGKYLTLPVEKNVEMKNLTISGVFLAGL